MTTTCRIPAGGTESSLRTLSTQNRIGCERGQDAPCGGALSGGNAQGRVPIVRPKKYAGGAFFQHIFYPPLAGVTATRSKSKY